MGDNLRVGVSTFLIGMLCVAIVGRLAHLLLHCEKAH